MVIKGGGVIARRGENIRQRKDGRFEARYKVGYKIDGSPIYKSVYGKTYTAVKEKRMKAIQKGNEKNKQGTTITVQDVSIRWLETKKTQIKQSTYVKYYDTVYNHIVPKIGNIKLKKIMQSIIDEYIRELNTNGRKDKKGGLSAKSIKEIIGVFKQILQYAKKEYDFYFPDFEYCLPKSKTHEIQTLTHEEQERFTTYLIQNIDRINLGLLICLLTGLRIGEVCALKYENIDKGKKCIKIKKTLQRIRNTEPNAIQKTIVIIEDPKSTASTREVPIKEFLLNQINRFKGSDNDFLLTGSTRKYIEPRTLQNRFKQVLREVKIKEVNYHALRHTFATNAIESGCDPKTLSELLGHSDIQLTLRTYVHSSYELKQRNIENMPIYYA